MSSFVSVLFVLLVFVYVLFVHKSDYSLSPYISGVIAGVCVLPLAFFFKAESYTSAGFFVYSFSYFIFYFLVSSAFGLLLYFLFNIKEFDVQTMPCALSGIWTVFFFFASYDFSRSPELAIYAIFLLSYIVSILFCDVLVMSLQTLPRVMIFLLSYPLTLAFAYLSTLSFAAWVYKSSPLLYLGIPSVFILLFLSLAILLAYKNHSTKKTRHHTEPKTVKEIFEAAYGDTYEEASL